MLDYTRLITCQDKVVYSTLNVTQGQVPSAAKLIGRRMYAQSTQLVLMVPENVERRVREKAIYMSTVPPTF